MAKIIKIDNFPGYLAEPTGECKGGLIVIHEVWGLSDHIKDVTDRFAAEGYLALAPDLLSETDIYKKLLLPWRRIYLTPRHVMLSSQKYAN